MAQSVDEFLTDFYYLTREYEFIIQMYVYDKQYVLILNRNDGKRSSLAMYIVLSVGLEYGTNYLSFRVVYSYAYRIRGLRSKAQDILILPIRLSTISINNGLCSQ